MKNIIKNATKNAIAISAIAGFVPVIGLDDDGAFLHFGWHGPKFATEEAARKAGEDYAHTGITKTIHFAKMERCSGKSMNNALDAMEPELLAVQRPKRTTPNTMNVQFCDGEGFTEVENT
jgi:hypothetical protein